MKIKRFVKPLLLSCAVGIPIWALSQNFHAVAAAAQSAKLELFPLVLLGLIVYTIVNASIWTTVLHGLGQNVTRLQATRAWIEAEAMKWLPGGIWGYASRVVRAPQIGVNRTIASASLVTELLLTIAAWFLCAIAGAWASGWLGKLLEELLPQGNHRGALLLGVLIGASVLFGLLIRHPLVRSKLESRFAPLREAQFKVAFLIRAFVSYLLLCVFHASLLQLLAHAVHPGGINLAEASCFDGTAWLIGFFAIGVPGGIGVREAGLAYLLHHCMPMNEAMAIAVIWRALQIVSEMLALVVSLAIGKSLRAKLAAEVVN